MGFHLLEDGPDFGGFDLVDGLELGLGRLLEAESTWGRWNHLVVACFSILGLASPSFQRATPDRAVPTRGCRLSNLR